MFDMARPHAVLCLRGYAHVAEPQLSEVILGMVVAGLVVVHGHGVVGLYCIRAYWALVGVYARGHVYGYDLGFGGVDSVDGMGNRGA